LLYEAAEEWFNWNGNFAVNTDRGAGLPLHGGTRLSARSGKRRNHFSEQTHD